MDYAVVWAQWIPAFAGKTKPRRSS